jgi:hypothetical protein
METPQGRLIGHGVILKVVSTNICESDQHMVRGRTTASAGLVLGHENTGEIVEAGNGSIGANITRNLAPYRALLGQLTFSGVFDRHPELKVVFCEGGATWVAQAITDMDYVVQTYHTQLKPKLGLMPSAYWHRQCNTSLIADRAVLRLIDIIGEHNVMWGPTIPMPRAPGATPTKCSRACGMN